MKSVYESIMAALTEAVEDAKASGNKMISLGTAPYYFKQGNRLYKITVN